MAIRDEVRILKSNTLEEFRQKSNELSIRNVGDDNLIHTNIGDKKESFTAAAGQKFFELTGRFEVLPDQTIDKVTGTAESYRVGAVRVTKQGTALIQGLASADFKVPNYTLKVTLTGSPTIPSEFVENAVLTQSGGFSGTLLSADSTTLRFKSFTGVLNTGQNLGIPHTDVNKRVVAGNISSKTDIDAGHGILIELITGASANDVIIVDSTSLVDAVNELQDDVGIVENLSTGQKVLTLAINEHETDLYGTGNVTFSGLSATGFQDAIEEVRTELGAHTSLGTDATSNVVGAVNELETAIRGSGSNYTLGTDAGNIISAINELETGIRGGTSDYTTTVGAGSITQDIDTLDAELGTITAGAMGTTASTVSGAIAEHETQLGNANINSIASGNNTITGALVQLHTELGSASLDTSATTHAGAINELHGEINSNDTDIATINTKLGTISAGAFGTSASTVSTAIAELHTDVDARVKLTSGSEQTIASDIKLGSGKTLDLSDGTLLLAAGGAGTVSSFGTAFLQVDGNLTSSPMGLRVDRDHISPSGSMTNHDVELHWDETLVASKPDRAWRLKGMATNGSANTADVVTFYNAQDLITSNTESGISVTWDSTAQNFDFNVNDPTISLTGDVTGSATMTNLGNVSIATTIAANSIALGTDTTGNYVSTIAGTSNEIEVSGSGSETATVTIGLPNDVTIGQDLTVTRDATVTRNLNVNGNTTLGNASSDTVSIPGDLTITGDLTVQGDTVTLNTETLTVEDTLVLAGNNLSSEPSSGGFGLEVGPITNPSGVASGVTGAHSIVYNYATDRWEADGSLILSQATLGSPKIENNNFESGDNLNFLEGTGMTLVTSKSGTTHSVSYANSDRGSMQVFYRHFDPDIGANASASVNQGTLRVQGLTGITTRGATDKITFELDDTSVTAGSYGSGSAIPTFTVDAQGRLTAAGSVSVDTYSGWNLTVAGTDRGNIAENENVSFVGGTAIDATYSATNNVITFNHADTSNVSNIDASGTTFVQDLTFDTHGHVTAASTGTFSLGNGTLTMNTSGGGISGSDTFTANATGNTTFTVTLNSSMAASNSTIVQRNASGYIYANYFNTDPNDVSSGVTKVCVETGNDGFIRHGTAGAIRSFINVADGATNTTNPNNATITIAAGTSLSGGGDFTTDQSSNETITIDHGDTSSQASVNNSGRTYIQDITLDTHGHITGITSATETAVSDTGTPAITSNGSTPSLNSGISAAEIRSLIGAGTSSSDDTGTPAILSNGSAPSLNSGISAAEVRSLIGAGTGNGNGNVTSGSSVDFDNLTCDRIGVNVAVSGTDGRIDAGNDVVAFSSSDRRWKENITPIENALDKVSQINGVEFDWKELTKEEKKTQHGFEGHDVGVIAQEIEDVLPEVVTTRDNGYKGVKYEKIVPLLIEAIKDLKAEIEELKDINKKV